MDSKRRRTDRGARRRRHVPVVAVVAALGLGLLPAACGTGGSGPGGGAAEPVLEVPTVDPAPAPAPRTPLLVLLPILLGGGGGATPPPVATPPAGNLVSHDDAATLEGVARLRQSFDREMDRHRAEWRNTSLAGGTDSTLYYALKLVLDGVLSMYEATGDRALLETALEWSENMVSTAHPVPDVDGGIGWTREDGSSSLLDELQASQPVARVARIVAADPALADRYGARAAALAAFVDEHVLTKWMVERPFGSYGTTWEWMVGVQDEAPGTLSGYIQGHQALTARLCLDVYDAGRRGARLGVSTWLDLGRDIASIIDGRLVEQANGSLLWDVGAYRWINSTTGIYDTSHANKFAFMITQFAERGRVFDAADVAGLGRTLTRNIWNGRTDWPDPGALPPGSGSVWFANYIDGQDAPFAGQLYRAGGPSHPHDGLPQGMSGMVYDGWCLLGRTSADAERACEALLAFIEATPSEANAIRNRNEANGMGTLALAGHLARNLRYRTW